MKIWQVASFAVVAKDFQEQNQVGNQLSARTLTNASRIHVWTKIQHRFVLILMELMNVVAIPVLQEQTRKTVQQPAKI